MYVEYILKGLNETLYDNLVTKLDTWYKKQDIINSKNS
jgi:hypothetical protein